MYIYNLDTLYVSYFKLNLFTCIPNLDLFGAAGAYPAETLEVQIRFPLRDLQILVPGLVVMVL